MNLAIDVGNTFTKIGVFEKEALIHNLNCPTENLIQCIDQLSKEFSVKKGIIAFVGNLKKEDLQVLKAKVSLTIMDSSVSVPFTNNYSTPLTLGVDRIALASAATRKYPQSNVLIIDAGTCITYDLITSKNEYLGGSISPGLKMRYAAMNHFTANLPLLSQKPIDSFIGSDTETSMHTGVIFGIAHEIDGFIEAYKNKFSSLTVILTGGDALFLRDKLKNDIFAHPNFLLEGLNYILEFNQF